MFFRAAMLCLLVFSGCAYRPMAGRYPGPTPREPWIETYYKVGEEKISSNEVQLENKSDYTVSELVLYTSVGEAKLEYYKKKKPSDELVFVFPILGGEYWFERYFARYLVEHGIDAAIILRNPEFKKPENIDRIEEVLRQSVLRDKASIDFFEKYGGKKQFGTFGISRGGVNAAITAGVDPRLKTNIIVMGGEDIVEIFRNTNQRGVGKYIDKVLAYKKYGREDLFNFLTATVKTDPKNLAQYMDAEHTLMFITAFDKTVPAHFQHLLRKRIGNPRTYYLATDHYVALLLTQFVPLVPPIRGWGILPFDFIERESLGFYRKDFGIADYSVLEAAYDLLALPSQIFFRTLDLF
jgi:hypothetical protein